MATYAPIIKVYVRLIQLGRRTIDQVPANIRDKVQEALNEANKT